MDSTKKIMLIKKHSPSSPLLKNLFLSFIIGGFICSLGEGIFIILQNYFIDDEKIASASVSLIFIVITAILTGFGIFDNIGKRAGAGTLVPVTGFANAVVSEALDSSSEGIILGVGAKIFTVAGPVILFGISSGVLYGIIYYFTEILL